MSETQVTSRQTNFNGWSPAGETWTYASADDPTYTFTISGDQTDKYSAGMRIKLTQTTVKYFIITAVSYSSPDTTITVYGGTDYDLANATITSPYYSPMKAPIGFSLDPDKWSVEVTSTTEQIKNSSIFDNTYYNVGSNSIDIPIGCWRVKYKCLARVDASVGDSYVEMGVGLGTTTDSVLDAFEYNIGAFQGADTSEIAEIVQSVVSLEDEVNLAVSDTYYLNIKCNTQNADISTLWFRNNSISLIIKATCAYL